MTVLLLLVALCAVGEVILIVWYARTDRRYRGVVREWITQPFFSERWPDGLPPLDVGPLVRHNVEAEMIRRRDDAEG